MASRAHLLVLAAITASLGSVDAAARKLPAAVVACSRNDANLNECALKNARAALPYIIKGDPSIGLPPSDPLHIPEFSVDDSKTSRQVALELKMKNVKVMGLRDISIDTMSVDVEKGSMSWTGTIPQLVFLGDYSVSGRVLLLPIKGSGAINITLDNVDFTYAVSLEGKGRELVNTDDNRLDFKSKRVYMNLDNLFGDKALSDQMNVFLNENWRELVQELGSPIGQVLNAAVKQVVTAVVKNVPFDDIFPDTSA